jgi:hypothetical protein
MLRLLGFMMLFVTLLAIAQLWLKTFVPQLQLPDPPKFDLETKMGRILTVCVGAVLGCMVGLISVSSGSIELLQKSIFAPLAPPILGEPEYKVPQCKGDARGHPRIYARGLMFALVLTTFFRLDPRKLVGTDISQAAILLMFTSLGHLSLGRVNWILVVPIWLGTVPGVLVGANLCKLIPQHTLRFVIYAILMMVSWK